MSAKYGKCPGCGRKQLQEDEKEFFDVIRCLDCGMMHCRACKGGCCSRCGSTRGISAGKVYPKPSKPEV